MEKYKISIVLTNYYPFSIARMQKPISINDIDLWRNDNELLIKDQGFDIGHSNNLEFQRNNRHSYITITLGFVNKTIVRESSIGIMSCDTNLLSLVRETIKEIKKITKAGVYISNPTTRAEMHARTFRYTEKMKQLYETGATILPLAGTNIVKNKMIIYHC